ncbi:MAG: hypothetical protein ACRYG8_06690 [Janthinobacterium lividum]
MSDDTFNYPVAKIRAEPPDIIGSMVRDALQRLNFIDELYLAAMLMRWNAHWGKPTAIHGPPDYYRRMDRISTTVTINSTLRGLGVRSGDQVQVRITVSEVYAQVQQRLALLRYDKPEPCQ